MGCLKSELEVAGEQQAATSEILRIISRMGPGSKAEPVLEAIVATAARLCGAEYALAHLLQEDGRYHTVASNNANASLVRYAAEHPMPPGRGSLTSRTALEGRTIHVEDCLADPEYVFPEFQRIGGFRTMLGVPLMCDGVAIGVLGLLKSVVAPFTEAQIALVTTFADQAVIALQNVRLFEAVQVRTDELEVSRGELSEALAQQTATADVLKTISRSTFDLQAVLDTLLESATRLCEAERAFLFRFDGTVLRAAAHYNASPELCDFVFRNPISPGRHSGTARAALERRTVHIPDVLADPEYSYGAKQVDPIRTVLGVPMLKGDELIGVFMIYRLEVNAFTEKQIELVETFADQAVIAIENVRLFEEVQARTREVTETLEYQTATSDVLEVISRSPTNVQPVFDTIAANALRLCDATWSAAVRYDGELIHLVSLHNVSTPAAVEAVRRAFPRPPSPGGVTDQAILTGKIANIPDVEAVPEYRHHAMARAAGFRSHVAVPMLRDGRPLGAIVLAGAAPGAFSDRQVSLLEAFADQAVIAINNVGLFEEVQTRTIELQESLEYQTATSDVLKAISRSAFDLQPVLETLVESAGRLCQAENVQIFLRDGEVYRLVAHNGFSPEYQAYVREHPIAPGRGTLVARTALEVAPVHIPDVLADPEYTWHEGQRLAGFRGVLGVPLLRDRSCVGVMAMTRATPQPFTARQIDLVTTFADQAVIAINNVRLFEEVQARTAELQESLEYQTATGDVLNVISRSPSHLQPILEAIAQTAQRLCMAERVYIFRLQQDQYRVSAWQNATPAEVRFLQEHPFGIDRGSITGRVALDAHTVHVPDVLADAEYAQRTYQTLSGFRAALGVPLMKDGVVNGVIILTRTLPRAFTARQIALVETFADQAVIATENVRLFEEVQARTRDLTEALQQQTATADVLKTISRSTFDLQTVLQTLVESAARLCDAEKATITRQKDDRFYFSESYGFSDEFMNYVRTVPVKPDQGTGGGRALLEGKIVHISDVQADPDYTWKEAQTLGDYRTVLCIPMLREGVPIGVLSLLRSEPRPFTDKQIELVSTFADQAAIAIENVRLFESLEARTKELARSLDELRAAQDRLVETQKLAALGQLTAGVAHEIKNPLNFVNNFADLSSELVDELRTVLRALREDGDARKEAETIAETIRDNLERIVQHGRRADSIVKNMLLHSREGGAEHRAIDLNASAEEALNLAYHSARAENPNFQVSLRSEFDPQVGVVEVYPQEFQRVLLNVISNGFYAARKRQYENADPSFAPELSLSTKAFADEVEIRVRDNGIGIPAEVKAKMFNPFFTTKAAGEGTGLGLSLSHDIVVKQHGGRIEAQSVPGEFTEFIITLPRQFRPDTARTRARSE